LSLADKQQLKRDANRQGETENLHEKSVVSRRIIYDYTARVGLVASKRRRLQQKADAAATVQMNIQQSRGIQKV